MRKLWELVFRRKAEIVTLYGDKIRFNIYSGDGAYSTAVLNADVKTWCKENLQRPHGVLCNWYGPSLGHVVRMWFMSDKDATFFKLFWM